MNNHQVGRISQRLETCCNWLYPPLAPLFLRWQRNRRARRVVEVLNEFCEAERLWTWIREPGWVVPVWIGEDGGGGFLCFFSLDIRGSSLTILVGIKKRLPQKKQVKMVDISGDIQKMTVSRDWEET